MAFGDVYKTAWRDEHGAQVEIVEGIGSDGPSFAMCCGHQGVPEGFPAKPTTLNAARALVAMLAMKSGWHADIKADVGLYDKDGNELPQPE